jgi:hypothetical protein
MARDAVATTAQIGPFPHGRLLLAGLSTGPVGVLWLLPEHWLAFELLRGLRERLAQRALGAWRHQRARNAPHGPIETL